MRCHSRKKWSRFPWIPALLLFIVLEQGIALSAPLPRWSVGDTWQVNAVYRMTDGGWSSPRNWFFHVTQENESGFLVEVRDAAAPRAWMYFEKESGQLRRIELIDSFRGEAVRREVRIEGNTPVYPVVSAIPAFFPRFFTNASPENYRFQAHLNGNPLPVEELEQSVAAFSRETLLERIPPEAESDMNEFVSPAGGRLYQVRKKNGKVFDQYWDMDGRFPWALYTESSSCRAWLAR